MRTLLYRFLFVVCLLGLLDTVYGQSGGGIAGVVIENDNGEPVPFANIAVLKTQDSTLVTGTGSDFSGKYEVSGLKGGCYLLKVSVLGFSPGSIDSIIVQDGQTTQLDTISLLKHKTQIDEIEVVAERPMIEQGVGKTILNVSEDIAGAGESALDLMKYLPSTSTDEENNVLLRGAPATIMVDGVVTDLANVMETLPVELISKIEVITNPSAKYSARNGSGIINVVLKKGKGKGTTGRVNLAVGSPEKVQAGGNVILKRNKLTFTTDVNAGYNIDEVDSWSNRVSESETDTTVLRNDGFTDRLNRNFLFRQGIRFQINDKSMLFFRGMYKGVNGESEGVSISKKWYVDDVLKSHNESFTDSESERHYWKASLNYKVDFSSLSNLTVLLERDVQDNSNPYERTIYYYNVDDGSQKDDYRTYYKTKPEDIWGNKLKVDLELGLNKHYKLETGLLVEQGSSEVYNDFIKIMHDYDTGSELYVDDVDSSQIYRFAVDELRPSVYGILLYEKKKWMVSGGVRYDYVYLDASSETDESRVESHFHNMLPSLQVSRRLDNKNTLGFSATFRTKIPKYQQLNPVVVYNGLYNKSSGNPDLKPEKIANVELNFQSMLKKHTINSALFVKRFTDMIGSYQDIVMENEYEVLYKKYENIGEVQQYGAEFNLNSRLPKKLNVKLNMLGMFQKIDNVYKGVPVEIEDFWYSTKLTASQPFYKSFKWQLTGIYNAPKKNISGENFEVYYVNAAIRGDLIPKKLSLSVSCSDVFNTLQRERTNDTTVKYSVYSYSKNISRKLLFALSYRFK